MKKVFLCGYYGFKNIGDEALLITISKIIKESSDEIELEALSYNVKYTESMFGIKGFSRKSLVRLIIKIFQSDYIVFGGGSLLQDVTSSKSLLYYLGIIFCGKICNKPVALIGNGFGPVNKPLNKFLVHHILNSVNFITVRDKESFDELKQLGVKTKIIVSADITFSISDWENTDTIDFFKKEKLVGISVRPWNNEDNYTLEIAKFADSIIDRGYEVVFIPMQYPIDKNISLDILRKMEKKASVLENEYTPNEIIKIISNLYILVGMRLHSLIFSTIALVPSIAIEYDPKIKSFAKEAGIINSGKLELIKYEDLITSFNEIENDYLEQSKKLDESLKYFVERAKLNKVIIQEMLNKF